MRPNALSRLVLALAAVSGGVASAQPGPPPQPPPPPMDTTMEPTDPGPPDPMPEPAPQPMPQPQPQPMPVVEPEPTDNGRPEGLSIGLGAGYGLPTSLETPNRTSARLRLASGLQFEPLVGITNTSESIDTGATETTNKETMFRLQALVRFPLMTRGKVDLELLGTAGFSNTKDNPEGDFNTTSTNSFDVGYGVGIAYWLSRHWNFSMSVTNPIVSYDHTKQQTGPGMSVKQGDTTIGLIFVPSVFMMVHLYN